MLVSQDHSDNNNNSLFILSLFIYTLVIQCKKTPNIVPNNSNHLCLNKINYNQKFNRKLFNRPLLKKHKSFMIAYKMQYIPNKI